MTRFLQVQPDAPATTVTAVIDGVCAISTALTTIITTITTSLTRGRGGTG